jgi:hypothetical protein
MFHSYVICKDRDITTVVYRAGSTYHHVLVLVTAVGSVNRLPVFLMANCTNLEQNGHQTVGVSPTCAAVISL